MKQIKDTQDYVRDMAELMGLNLTPEYLPGVVANFDSLKEIALLVTEFDLPDDVETAPIFEP